jgi:tRNA dimethylallyltransferase
VDRMWQDGLVDEVRALARADGPAGGLRAGRTASRALGYAQVLRFLDGDWTQEQAREQTIQATRRFARRQESWFRRDPRVRWLPADQPVPTSVALAAISDQAVRPEPGEGLR